MARRPHEHHRPARPRPRPHHAPRERRRAHPPAPPRRTLLDALRFDLGLTGTKRVCDEGECGACTVLVDGRPQYACLRLAIDCEGPEIETIEGLARNEAAPIVEAFCRADALQCGFCTPGQVVAIAAAVRASKDPERVARALSGNRCRRGTYPNIRAAIEDLCRA